MLTAVASSSNQSHPVQNSEVLDDGLTTDRKVAGQRRRGRFSTDGQPLQEDSSRGIGERCEDFGDVAHGESKSGVSRLAITYVPIAATTLFQPLE